MLQGKQASSTCLPSMAFKCLSGGFSQPALDKKNKEADTSNLYPVDMSHCKRIAEKCLSGNLNKAGKVRVLGFLRQNQAGYCLGSGQRCSSIFTVLSLQASFSSGIAKEQKGSSDIAKLLSPPAANTPQRGSAPSKSCSSQNSSR